MVREVSVEPTAFDYNRTNWDAPLGPILIREEHGTTFMRVWGITILGDSEVCYDPDRSPLPRVWIRTAAELEVDDSDRSQG